MTHPSEPEETVAPPIAAAAEQQNGAKAEPTSPARSDKSSDSEGKPVRDKLKETRIDAHTTADQSMVGTPNGSALAVDQSASGSDTDRGRLQKKRSREDFEEEGEPDKHSEKTERHRRKKSRDTSKDLDDSPREEPAPTSVPHIQENDEDAHMTSPEKPKSAAPKDVTVDSTVKNKRTRDQVEEGAEAGADGSTNASANGKAVPPIKEERDSKRPKDEAPSATNAVKLPTKVCTISSALDFSHMTNNICRYPWEVASPTRPPHRPLQPCPQGLRSQRLPTRQRTSPLPPTTNSKPPPLVASQTPQLLHLADSPNPPQIRLSPQ